ncbi:MAG: hypothetical protein ABSA46_06400 [Thermodesulfovibrionales bacterium]
MSRVAQYLLPAVLVLFAVTVSYGASDSVVPYGDYSQWCSAYGGTCKEDLGPREAEEAIEGYFSSKGLRVTNIRHKERFVEADIYRNDRLIDKVLFDRKTGRMRSTY